jgi:hypothetical protein
VLRFDGTPEALIFGRERISAASRACATCARVRWKRRVVAAGPPPELIREG